MIEDMPPSMVPDDLVEHLRSLPASLDESDRWDVERLVEWAFHLGYSAGYSRGHGDGLALERRSADRERGAHVPPKRHQLDAGAASPPPHPLN